MQDFVSCTRVHVDLDLLLLFDDQHEMESIRQYSVLWYATTVEKVIFVTFVWVSRPVISTSENHFSVFRVGIKIYYWISSENEQFKS